MGSATVRNPAALPSTAINITDFPSSCSVNADSSIISRPMIFSSCRNADFPILTSRPSTVPATPPPVTERKSDAFARTTPRSLAPCTIAAASGCSLPCSNDAANNKISCAANPPAGRISISLGLPSVSVPVLSITSVSTFSSRSSVSAFFTSTPACAPRPTPTMIDMGVAKPRAQGQAIIRTATALTTA